MPLPFWANVKIKANRYGDLLKSHKKALDGNNR
jgi:hypothetical protein